MSGKECILLPDNDDPGREYAVVVAAILAALTPVAVVKVLALPGLPEHGDIVEWIEAQ